METYRSPIRVRARPFCWPDGRKEVFFSFTSETDDSALRGPGQIRHTARPGRRARPTVRNGTTGRSTDETGDLSCTSYRRRRGTEAPSAAPDMDQVQGEPTPRVGGQRLAAANRRTDAASSRPQHSPTFVAHVGRKDRHLTLSGLCATTSRRSTAGFGSDHPLPCAGSRSHSRARGRRVAWSGAPRPEAPPHTR